MQAKIAIRFMLFGLGFLSIGTQIYLMREFLIVCNGNELILGVVLALWMLLTGTGAYLGRFSNFIIGKIGFAIFMMIIAGLLPSLMVISLDLFKVLMIPHGSMAGIWMIIMAATFVQLPFCLLNGFLFSYLSVLSSENSLAESYSWESLGSMASGALVNMIFLWIFDPYQSLFLLTAFYFIMMSIFSYTLARRTHFYVGIFFSISILVALLYFDFLEFSEKILFKDQPVITNMGTPYGQVVVTKNQNQLNFYENGLLLFSGGNEINNEENVHLAMVQCERPRNVLLISGGYSGTLSEILKYKPDVVDYVEMNPSLIRIAAKFTKQLDHPSVRVHEMDARKFIRSSNKLYDIVLVNLPAPSTLQLNRYYTIDFLNEIKKTMKPDGVIAYSLPTGSDYISKQAGRMNSILFQTLKQRFNQVLIIPVQRNYFLASDSALDIDIPALIRQKQIQTVYVNQYYLDVRQLRERSAYVTNNSTLTGNINSDFYPGATFYQNLWWLGYFSVHPMLIIAIFLVILLILLASLNSISAGLFTGGFTLASTEIILIFGLQVIYGYIFQAIGLIIMVFMIGLAVGSGFRYKIYRIKPYIFYILLQIGLAVYSLILPFLLLWLSSGDGSDTWVQTTLVGFAFLASFFVGIEYRVAAELTKSSPRIGVAGNYSADMFGSGMGAVFVMLILIPLSGIIFTGIFLAVLNIFSALILFIRQRKIVSL
ncbi:MAG: hypothetical protein WCK84_03375 [Bacteroidota bacterium]